MLGDVSGLDILLNSVDAQQSASSARALAMMDDHAPRSRAILFSCAASWSTRTDPRKAGRSGPPHQTMRRRGKAPPYPRPIDLTRGVPGKLVMLREGLALEPLDARQPCTHIGAATIRRVSFYADCIELIHGKGDRTLVRCEPIEALDLKFEAHYHR